MKYYRFIIPLAFGTLFLQGCIAFPPLVQVEHKHSAPAPSASNEEVLRRLDAIDNRLNQIEKNPGR